MVNFHLITNVLLIGVIQVSRYKVKERIYGDLKIDYFF